MSSPLEAAREFTFGQLGALLVKLGGEENARRLLRGEVKCKLEVVKMILAINRTTPPFDSASFIGSGWAIWRGQADGKGLDGEEQQDDRSLALTEVDFARAHFETCLVEEETNITGEERLARLREMDLIRADANIGAALINEPGQTTLKWLYETHGVTWFELPGTELRRPGGGRCFLCLYRRGAGQWRWDYGWLFNVRNARNPALVFAS
jgi:hypothetical protein